MSRRTTATAAVTPLPSPKERRRLREAKSLSEEQVATAVGVTRATVRSWETGRGSPRGRRREAYARLLGCAVDLPTDPPADPPIAPPAHPRSDRQQAAADSCAEPSAPDARPGPAATSSPPSGPPPRMLLRDAPTPSVDITGISPALPTPSDVDVATGTTTAAEPSSEPSPERPPAPASSPAHGTGFTAAEAFDALYAYAAPGLVRQTYLLTGRRALSREAVEHAFQLAWHRWPEVAKDRDPAGWVRAAAHEYAMSPWHRLRRAHRRPDAPPQEPARRALLDAMLTLPPAHRRTLLLYDGVGLDLPETAAETEASTAAAASRLMSARAAVAERLPEQAGPCPPDEQSALLNQWVGGLAPDVRVPAPPPARAVRAGSEGRARLWTRAVVCFAVLLTGATVFTLQTAPTRYVQPLAPAERVGGVPPRGGPQKLTPQDLELQKSLRGELVHGPERLVPRIP